MASRMEVTAVCHVSHRNVCTLNKRTMVCSQLNFYDSHGMTDCEDSPGHDGHQWPPGC